MTYRINRNLKGVRWEGLSRHAPFSKLLIQ